MPASAYFEQIYTQYPQDRFFVLRARFNELLRCGPWGDPKLMKQKIVEFEKDFPEEKKYINTLNELYDQQMKK